MIVNENSSGDSTKSRKMQLIFRSLMSLSHLSFNSEDKLDTN